MQQQTKKSGSSTKYETPRLQTYGKLKDLTRGTATPELDADQTFTKA
jgi:hypothetical protein